ncbi:hypothetical protein TSAR_011995 [Trichomalopsis sarcophagae]|uniref:Uncharacterized protein n=1 Tax=Trichomalopsis sarcophagae TaxID=543379 RepID=A0A232EHT2_9HYME|nr:hypothetical protein TSAR_011995 [Trichomalopsis sarcophagae]
MIIRNVAQMPTSGGIAVRAICCVP